MSETTAPVPSAAILGWRYEYRFLAPDRVDIDVHLSFRKDDDTPIVVGASLFAAGDTTPSGVVDAGTGVYDVLLPIRGFHCIPWTPHTIAGGAQKRYLLNMKLTTVPESEWDEPDMLSFLGGTIGFAQWKESQWQPKTASWTSPTEDAEEASLRAQLTQLRADGVDLLKTLSAQSEIFYNLCDELGICVAQESGEESYLAEDLARVGRHPCVMADSLSATG